MSVLEILTIPHPILRKKATEVEEINDEIRKMANDILETALASDRCAGLAANQVGLLKRIFVSAMDEEGNVSENPIIMINPTLKWESEERFKDYEGCMSIPGFFGKVERPAEIKIDYLDLTGKNCSLHAKKWVAKNILHELDHLDGVLFTDHLSRLKRQQFKKHLEKQAINIKDV